MRLRSDHICDARSACEATSQDAAARSLFSGELDGTRAAELGLAWACLPDDEVEDHTIALARRPAKDPELAHAAVASFRTEFARQKECGRDLAQARGSSA